MILRGFAPYPLNTTFFDVCLVRKARFLRQFLSVNVLIIVFRASKGTCFTGFSWLLLGASVDAQKARFLRAKCGLSGLMNFVFRSFRPLESANVSAFSVLFSACLKYFLGVFCGSVPPAAFNKSFCQA